METKISQAQIEVWEWKERLHEELKHLPRNKRLQYINEKPKETVEMLKKEKQKV